MKEVLDHFLLKVSVNQAWLFIGLETFIVGCYFVFFPDSVTGYTPFHFDVSFMDNAFPAILWITLGVLVMFNKLFTVWPDYTTAYGLMLLGLWGFYASMMIMRDLNDPHPPVIGLSSLFYLVIMLRILVLLLFDDKKRNHRKGGGEHQ